MTAAAHPDLHDVEGLADAETPVGLIDVGRARANAEAAVSYLAEHGLSWRPHVKTHKSLRVARIQLEAGARGLTVATPREAEVMSTVCDDLLLAYPPVGRSKVRRVTALPERVRLKVALDSEAALAPLAESAADAGRAVDVLVEVDVGMGRVGVQTPDAAVALARVADRSPGARFAGILFYPGHVRGPVDAQEGALRDVGAHVRTFVEALASVDLAPAVVSGGSTPTVWGSHLIPHLTEVRAGTLIFNDRDIVALGAASHDDLAYTVLATVVSTAVPGQAVIDAGSKALAKEARGGEGGGGATYGSLLERPEVTVKALSEEHGLLDLGATDWRPAVGDRVRVVPNHVCVSVNLQDELLAVTGDGRLERWPLEGRGRGPAA